MPVFAIWAALLTALTTALMMPGPIHFTDRVDRVAHASMYAFVEQDGQETANAPLHSCARSSMSSGVSPSRHAAGNDRAARSGSDKRGPVAGDGTSADARRTLLRLGRCAHHVVADSGIPPYLPTVPPPGHTRSL
ncbi:hypothetical protein [Gemmatimonas aurantiaca]|uniref:hypothetical protein n=1 Tax=Gemmatimonas aurantiaca TaxID=173480 RepID=UPI00301D7311